ncbi:MAG: hypothetical protein KZQ64_14265 [gamma proteobacterium symbiont of Bathyaustriella thionipta]|nr:hypothetical protein [gamma proteobacterium symbiont of Bathyaustriella thionipta]MCU7950957.1 hypothetical protein [gamma proteobacterium symbiont of Bathyaustriella thionipta]MCU7954535.1 hypothetical protein [gamma proteobacterium symbiont of Bathyaustriella thionipta]MCU7957450.1 hypothetical protein [gamma proteobacterium symbiont of Bathyaustriella thionipta]MCU7968444.1 hypothetical protein [gamma proteobacterium symbiont of Bathyaustriella thionipta]
MGGIFYKEILSAIAIVLTFIAFAPYIHSIIKGTIKPHVFSWIIWGTTTFVVFLAQLDDNGGVGARPIGVSGIITIFIAFLAYIKRTDITIKGIDWIFFISAMSSLPFWYFTSDPLWAVVILTTVDVLGFGPTLRKAYFYPHSESLLFFALFFARNFLVIMALENYSVTTVLFPAVIALACVFLMTMLIYRRRVLVTVEK